MWKQSILSRNEAQAQRRRPRHRTYELREFFWSVGIAERLVRDWFYKADESTRVAIFDDYEAFYGRRARRSAERKFHSWSAGTMEMSAMIAERAFQTAPKFMEPSLKYHLAHQIWSQHSRPPHKSGHVGSDVDPDDVLRQVREQLSPRLDGTVPSWAKCGIEWLLGDDVVIKEQLIGHFTLSERLDSVPGERVAQVVRAGPGI
jgi:hypothetical protein